MSTMANQGFGNGPEYVEERTSVMAIMALVLSLICFVPGLGVIGVILGIAALVAISGSRGRLAGKGMAVAGIILGLIFSAIWLGVGIGVSKGLQFFNEKISGGAVTAMENIEQGDFAAARTLFQPAHAEKITDADFIAFRDEYTAAIGSFSGGSTGLMEMFTLYGQIQPALNRIQGRNEAVPLPMQFANGPALLVLELDTTAPSNGDTLPIRNMQVITNSGQEITLYDPGRLPAGGTAPGVPAPPAPAATPNPPSVPETAPGEGG